MNHKRTTVIHLLRIHEGSRKESEEKTNDSSTKQYFIGQQGMNLYVFNEWYLLVLHYSYTSIKRAL